MRAGFIVKLDIFLHTFAEALLRGVLTTIRLFFFERGEKSLRYGVVMGSPRGGKGLPHAALSQERDKRLGCVLLSTITMEGQPLRPPSILKRLSERRRDKIRAGVLGYLVTHDLSGIQIQYHTKIQPMPIDSEIGEITDPYLIGLLCGKLLLQQIRFRVPLVPFVILLCVCTYAFQSQLLHDGRYPFRARSDTVFRKDNPDFSAPYLCLLSSKICWTFSMSSICSSSYLLRSAHRKIWL